MNVQAHMSGPAGQVPNQAASGAAPQNGSTLAQQMHNLGSGGSGGGGGVRAIFNNVDAEMIRARTIMQDKM